MKQFTTEEHIHPIVNEWINDANYDDFIRIKRIE